MGCYSINELYEFTPQIAFSQPSLRNPLTDEGALNESEFIDMRLSAQRSRVGIIIDVRGLGFGTSNTAVLVLTGVGNVAWSNDDRQLPWHARRGGWEPTTSAWNRLPGPQMMTSTEQWASDAAQGSDDATALPTMPEAAYNETPEYILRFESLTVSSLGAQIYIGHVEGMDGPPPDMGEMSDRDLIAGFPQWSSVMAVQGHHTYPYK